MSMKLKTFSLTIGCRDWWQLHEPTNGPSQIIIKVHRFRWWAGHLAPNNPGGRRGVMRLKARSIDGIQVYLCTFGVSN